jgi:hypothetical protein
LKATAQFTSYLILYNEQVKAALLLPGEQKMTLFVGEWRVPTGKLNWHFAGNTLF